MEVSQEKINKAVEVFGLNVGLKAMYMTADFQCFPVRYDAVTHAQTLEIKDIDFFERTTEEDQAPQVKIDEAESESATNESDKEATKKGGKNKGSKTQAEDTSNAQAAAQTEATAEVNVPPASEDGSTIIDTLNSVVNDVEQALGIAENKETV